MRTPRLAPPALAAASLTAVLLVACSSGTAQPVSAASEPLSNSTPGRSFEAASPPAASVASAALASHHTVDADLGAKVDAFFAADSLGRYRNRRAVIVTVDGRLAVARYEKSTATDTWDVQAVGSAVTATLIGIALDQGRLRSLAQTLPDLLPQYSPDMTNDVQDITLGEVLTQTVPLPGDDVFYRRVWATSQDWVFRILRDGPTYIPGFVDSSAAPDLLSAILTQATGQNTLDYARTQLFTPLGISTTPADDAPLLPANLAAYSTARFAWPTDPKGHYLGGSQKLTALDVAKLGQLWLDDGQWQGHQLVSADFVHRMHSPLQIVGAENDGAPIGYGYGLYSARITGHQMYAATGIGGQLLEVVPDLGLVVAILSQSPVNPLDPVDSGVTATGSDYDTLISTIIEPAIH